MSISITSPADTLSQSHDLRHDSFQEVIQEVVWLQLLQRLHCQTSVVCGLSWHPDLSNICERNSATGSNCMWDGLVLLGHRHRLGYDLWVVGETKLVHLVDHLVPVCCLLYRHGTDK